MNDLDLADDLHALLDRNVADLPVPTDRLRSGAVQRGRAVRRRRRVLAGAGTLAAAAVVGALVVPSLAGGHASDADVANDTSRSPDLYEPPAGWWDMPSRVMRNRLDDLLPADLTIASTDLGNDDLGPGEKPHGGWVTVDVADAGSTPLGGLNIVLYAPQPAGNDWTRQQLSCPGNLDGPASCTEVLDSNGDPVGRTARSEMGDVVVLEITRLMDDGGVVYASASNSDDDKWGEGSSVVADEPPVTSAQLKTIALSPAWTAWEPRD